LIDLGDPLESDRRHPDALHAHIGYARYFQEALTYADCVGDGLQRTSAAGALELQLDATIRRDLQDPDVAAVNLEKRSDIAVDNSQNFTHDNWTAHRRGLRHVYRRAGKETSTPNSRVWFSPRIFRSDRLLASKFAVVARPENDTSDIPTWLSAIIAWLPFLVVYGVFFGRLWLFLARPVLALTRQLEAYTEAVYNADGNAG
jgi:hypothetical protein